MNTSIRRSNEDFGPLTPLIGIWSGEKGTDVSPEEDGTETNQYQEVLTIEPVEDVDNAEEQELIVLRYHQVITRIRDQKMIHNESGYLSWDEGQQLLMKSFSIPRAVALIAGGTIKALNSEFEISVRAAKNDPDWQIIESPFMKQKASTSSYQFNMRFDGETITYTQSMTLAIYGKTFEHTDENTLTRVAR